MNEKQIKRTLEDNGIKVIDVARRMHTDFADTITERSAETMLRNLIAGRSWYPTYARWFNRRYAHLGVCVDKPDWVKPVRERMAAKRIAA